MATTDIEFTAPTFIEGNTPEEIQQRMMDHLPKDIDNMPGGFPYDFTMPTAIEKSELITYNMVALIQLMFPHYAWDEWLDLHARMCGLERRPAGHATGYVTFTGSVGTNIPAGTVCYVLATENSSTIEFTTDSLATIPDSGSIEVPVTAVETGPEGNVNPDSIIALRNSISGVTNIGNAKATSGGTDIEDDESLRARIIAALASIGLSFVGNDADFIRWAKEITSVGNVVVIPHWNGPGTVKLVLTDSNGDPASDAIVKAVYDHLVSPDDRSQRLIATGTCELTVAAVTVHSIDYVCTGLKFDPNETSLDQIVTDFKKLMEIENAQAIETGTVYYNQMRGRVTECNGVLDFDTFLMNGSTDNIELTKEEIPKTGTVTFS